MDVPPSPALFRESHSHHIWHGGLEQVHNNGPRRLVCPGCSVGCGLGLLSSFSGGEKAIKGDLTEILDYLLLARCFLTVLFCLFLTLADSI